MTKDELINEYNKFCKTDDDNYIFENVNNLISFEVIRTLSNSVGYENRIEELFEAYTELINYYENDMNKLFSDIDCEKHISINDDFKEYGLDIGSVLYYKLNSLNIWLTIYPDKYNQYSRKYKLDQILREQELTQILN